jgi:hypothetical protein
VLVGDAGHFKDPTPAQGTFTERLAHQSTGRRIGTYRMVTAGRFTPLARSAPEDAEEIASAPSTAAPAPC